MKRFQLIAVIVAVVGILGCLARPKQAVGKDGTESAVTAAEPNEILV